MCYNKNTNNVRWGTSETYRYCFDGIDTDSIVAIGTVGGSPRKYIDRLRFEEGLAELVRVLRPHTIVVYGSANYPCFEKRTGLATGRNGNTHTQKRKFKMYLLEIIWR